jgi:thioredoxin 1
MTELNTDTFDLAIKDPGLTLVDFWAGWCMPCKIFSPVIESLADEMDGRASFAKVDIDENQSLAVRYGIESIPTVLFFKDGKVVDRLVGVRQRGEVISAIEKHI